MTITVRTPQYFPSTRCATCCATEPQNDPLERMRMRLLKRRAPSHVRRDREARRATRIPITIEEVDEDEDENKEKEEMKEKREKLCKCSKKIQDEKEFVLYMQQQSVQEHGKRKCYGCEKRVELSKVTKFFVKNFICKQLYIDPVMQLVIQMAALTI